MFTAQCVAGKTSSAFQYQGASQTSNKAMGLSSSVVLDQGFEAGRAFGASGTPSAILVDAKGKIASEVAVGAPGVLKLATLKCKRKEKGGLP